MDRFHSAARSVGRQVDAVRAVTLPSSPPAPLREPRRVGLSTQPKRLPSVLDALELHEENQTGGVFGIGLQVDPKTFEVIKINDLVVQPGTNVPKMLSVGDTLLRIDGNVLGKEGNTLESLIPGSFNTFVNLSFRDLETVMEFEVVLMRHTPIQVWQRRLRWYQIREHLAGQDLCADPKLVSLLEGIRDSVVERSGDFVDLLRYWQPDPQMNLGLRFVGKASGPGTVVSKLSPGCPAQLLSLVRPGDEVRAVNGVEVTGNNLQQLLNSTEVAIRRKASLKVYRQGVLNTVEVPCTAQANMRAIEQMFGLIGVAEQLVSGGAEQDKVLEALRVVHEHARSMECRRVEEEVRCADALYEAQASIANQVLDCEVLLRPIRAFTKGLEDLVPRVDVDAASADAELHKAAADRLRTELERLRAQLEQSVPRQELVQSRANEDRLRARVQQMLEDTVPKPIHSAEVQRLGEELRRYEELIGGMAPKADLERLREEKSRLEGLIVTMVPKAELDHLRLHVEETMVPNSALAAAQAELAAARVEVDRLRAALSDAVPMPVHEAEVGRLGLQADHLHRQLGLMVPRDALTATEEELKRARDQMLALEARLQLMVPQGDLEAAQALLAEMLPRAEAQAERARLQRLLDSQVARAFLFLLLSLPPPLPLSLSLSLSLFLSRSLARSLGVSE